jgi:gamma-glutamylcyclotransferase (GGCT)/AIG2-like uncharacterized protein YtfP
MTECLFAYGTLLPDHAPAPIAGVVRQLERVGRAFVSGRLYDLGEFPAAILDDNAPSKVWGVVFRLRHSEQLLPHLDAYEGFDPKDPASSLFVRQRHYVSLTHGERLKCWVYVYNRTPLPESFLPGGDYRLSASQTKTRASSG